MKYFNLWTFFEFSGEIRRKSFEQYDIINHFDALDIYYRIMLDIIRSIQMD